MSETLNRHTLTEAVAKNCLITSSKAEEVLQVVFDEFESAFLKGRIVRFAGFGTFLVKKQKARSRYNFSTGGKINVPEKKTISFLPSKKVLEKLNDSLNDEKTPIE